MLLNGLYINILFSNVVFTVFLISSLLPPSTRPLFCPASAVVYYFSVMFDNTAT
jgi:hypothetical protein